MADEPHHSATRLSERWDVHVETVYRWMRQGKLRFVRLPSGLKRVPESEARRYDDVLYGSQDDTVTA